MNVAIRRKLVALEHPQEDTATVDNETQLRALVKWAETHKIKFYKPADRMALDATDAPGWPAALDAYIKELGGEVVATDSQKGRESIADWLLSYAIGREYSDRADWLQKLVAAPASAAATPPDAQPHKYIQAPSPPAQTPAVKIHLDTDTPEFRTSLEGLADTLRLPQNENSEEMVRACAAVLEQKLSAAARARAQVAAASKGKGRQQGQHSAPTVFSLKDFPPGFDTGDEQLNKVGLRDKRNEL